MHLFGGTDSSFETTLLGTAPGIGSPGSRRAAPDARAVRLGVTVRPEAVEAGRRAAHEKVRAGLREPKPPLDDTKRWLPLIPLLRNRLGLLWVP